MNQSLSGRKPRAVHYLGVLVLFIGVSLGLGTVVPRPFFTSVPALAGDQSDAKQARTVLMLSSAIHTDLALPVDAELIERFAFLAADGLDPGLEGAEYIIVGWGGRSFYIETPTWSDLKPVPVFKALTVDRSVMHVSLAGEIDPGHPSVSPLYLDADAYERLVASVLASFTLGADAAPVVLADAGYGDYDRFYEAEGWFNAIAGCNVWTARMLRRSGLKTGWWTPLPVLLTSSLGLHNHVRASGYSPVAR